MIEARVIDQDSRRVVLEGRVFVSSWDDPIVGLTQRWTVAVSALVANPGLLAQGRDELIARLDANYTNWQALQIALGQM